MSLPLHALDDPHAHPAEQALRHLGTGRHGLTSAQVSERLALVGGNALPRAKPPSLSVIFLGQYMAWSW